MGQITIRQPPAENREQIGETQRLYNLDSEITELVRKCPRQHLADFSQNWLIWGSSTTLEPICVPKPTNSSEWM
jgi:hypothetical protein